MKVAVSIPDSIFEAAEQLAREQNMPRSQVFAEALADYIEAHGPGAVTQALNKVYSGKPSGLDEELEIAQLESLDDETW